MKEYNLKTKRPKFFHCVLSITKFILRIFFKAFFRIKVYGLEKIPKNTKLVLCSNHISYADPVIIYAWYPGIIFFMAKVEAFTGWLPRTFLRYFTTFPVNRKKFDRQAIRYSLQVLNENEVVGIFPEGTRSTDGVIREAQKGVGLIAVMGQSNVLPVAISGTNKIIQKPHKRIFFPQIRLIFGNVIDTQNIINQYGHSQAPEKIIEYAMDSIKLLYKKISIQ
ncbi:MAG: 1-acyl-sn-glycerol-3-phosphate acyltransferase [Actinobacteria bacterium]|nr:1-acyl-sn-glycerol-3-phosphate acyltransferase [Actinomycetota bacterium]